MDSKVQEKKNLENQTSDKEEEKFEDPVESFDSHDYNVRTENKEKDRNNQETEHKGNEDSEENEDKQEIIRVKY